jgi:glutamate--cysteine ligase
MPSAARSLDHDAVRRFVSDQVFAPTETRDVGIELEWFARPVVPPLRVPEPAELRALLPPELPGGSRITFEPGGQLELSGPRMRDVGAACDAMRADIRSARESFVRAGIELVGIGLDSGVPRPRLLDEPRYRAMEEYFDTRWPAGRTMMRNTAAIQVNLDIGRDAQDVDARWHRVHDIGPVLLATFANSPFDVSGRPSGWRSTRAAVWSAIDPCRTATARRDRVAAPEAWADYALAAPMMLIRADEQRSVALHDAFPFGRWVDDGHELGWPTQDDLAYHLTTLFPPVRPRGWLELRMIDALPEEWWPVAVAVATALVDDPEAAAAMPTALRRVRDAWTGAAHDALAMPELREAAQRCFALALEALPRIGADATTIDAAERYHDHYVARGRCPADDRLDEWVAFHSTVA